MDRALGIRVTRSRGKDVLGLVTVLSLVASAPVVGQGFSFSGLAGYEAVTDVFGVDLDNGFGVEFLASRYWLSGLEIGIGATVKLHEDPISCVGVCGDLDAPLEVEFYTFMVESRYWFGDAVGARGRLRPFVGARLGLAAYRGDFKANGIQFGAGAGLWYRLFAAVGLSGAATVDGLAIRAGENATGPSFSTTRVSLKAGVRVAVS